jgi:hypothetical protein
LREGQRATVLQLPAQAKAETHGQTTNAQAEGETRDTNQALRVALERPLMPTRIAVPKVLWR